LTFGGKDLKTLFITTRMEGEDNSSEHAGGIFATEIAGVKGAAAAYPFIL
jgi:sugar lactone lactonase YvrE